MLLESNKSILVTGGAGFIGSNFVSYFCNKYPNYNVVVLDKLTYAGSLDSLSDCCSLNNYNFIHGDICDVTLLRDTFEKYDIRGVIHFAAESHVDNSIVSPRTFLETNICGTFTLLETAKWWWLNDDNTPRYGYEDCRFHNVSTDEVYGELSLGEGCWTEESKMLPNSPYSATKASADFLVRSFLKAYSLNVTTSNCGNNYGPKQHIEKFIPIVITKCLEEDIIPIHGEGANIRDWIYVFDHCKAVDLIFHQGKKGETYNIGNNEELSNLIVAQKICSACDSLYPREGNRSYSELINFIPNRPLNDFRYGLNVSKIKGLGWQAEESFDSSIIKTIDWYWKAYTHNSQRTESFKRPNESEYVEY